jgi:transglutaminase-like putative cysteine protease
MSERWRIREGWGVLLLSLALTMIVSFAISGAGWTEGLSVISLASLGAFIIGIMIAKSRLPGWIGHLFSLVIGLAWSFRLVTSLFPASYTWEYRWAWLWTYIYQWTTALVSGGVSHDNMVFVLQMALIVWEITYVSLWLIFRSRHAWLAIVPGAVLLLVNLSYAPNDITAYLLIYLALAFLLVIRFNLFNQEQIWRREGVHFNADEINFDFLRAGAIFTLVILTLAWVTPTAVAAQQTSLFDALRGPWRDLQVQWTRLFASLNYRSNAGVDFYGAELTLGGPRELSEVPVLEVRTSSSARYWRAVVFDKFTGQRWENTDSTLASFGADNELLPMIPYQARQVITHTSTLLGPSMSSLPMAAQPLWVTQPARASLSFVDVPVGPMPGQSGATNISQGIDTLSYVQSRVPLRAGESYIATSMLSIATEAQLRSAGTRYPTWITNRYLQVPDSVPSRVRQLAETIAAPYSNPYDKASAIEHYLRSEIAYNEKINAPPPDRDPVDYILFDLKQAYCDYYATSMAVMVRSLGIPARIVSGYAQGTYNAEKDAYIVELKDAHTWVEVFFPAYGWVEFEPTAAQPAIVRPVAEQETGSDQGINPTPDLLSGVNPMDRKEEMLDQELPDNTGSSSRPFWTQLDSAKPGSWVFGSLVLLALAGLIVWTAQNRRSSRLTSIGSIYHSMLRLAGWAGANLRSSQTPSEHASAVAKILPEGEKPAQHIVGLYTRERYGHKGPDEAEQAIANEFWHELRSKLIQRGLLRHLLRRR